MKTIPLCTTVVGFAFYAHADVFTNITEVVRAGNAAAVTLVQGVSYGSYPVAHAFDGDVTNTAGRALFNTRPTDMSPIIIRYDISDDFKPGAHFTVTAFRFYRALWGDEYDRSITQIRLEASETGEGGWATLASNGDKIPNDAISAAVPFYTVNVPASARRSARHFRFVITANAGRDAEFANVSTCELELLGDIQSRPEVVSSSSDWGWRPSVIVDGASAHLDGTNEVAGLVLTNAGVQTVSGGTLAMRSPGRIRCKDGDTITSAIAGGKSGMDTATSCVDGVRIVDEYLPADASSGYATGVPTIVWTNRKVSEIIDIDAQEYYFNGNNGYDAYPMFLTNADYGISLQMHSHGSSSTLILGEGVKLWQEGDNVMGRALWSTYKWNVSEPYDFTTQSSFVGKLVDDGNLGSGCYGIRGILARSDISSAMTVACGAECALPAATWLPRSDGGMKTGKAVTFFKNDALGGIGEFVSANFSAYKNDIGVATPYHVVRTASAVTVQFQIGNPSATNCTLCVKVEFTQNGPDVNARIVYAKYVWTANALGCDFDQPTINGAQVGETNVNDGTDESGYGVRNILMKRGGRLHLDGPFASTHDVAIFRGGMEFGASSLALESRFIGDGFIAFSPAGESQTVAFNGSCLCDGGLVLTGATIVTVGDDATFATNAPVALNGGATLALADGTANAVGELSLAGTNTIHFGAGSSLSAASLTVTDGATVNVVLERADDATNCLRIGTSCSLSRDDLRRFRVDGRTGVSQLDDGWLDFSIPGLIFLLR